MYLKSLLKILNNMGPTLEPVEHPFSYEPNHVGMLGFSPIETTA